MFQVKSHNTANYKVILIKSSYDVYVKPEHLPVRLVKTSSAVEANSSKRYTIKKLKTFIFGEATVEI